MRPALSVMPRILRCTRLYCGKRKEETLLQMSRASVTACLILFATAARSVDAAAAAAASLFLFGDSMLDVGNNEFIPNSTNVANFPPYGETHFHKPSGRFSNGLIISDFIARFMGFRYSPPPSLKPGANFSQGANFASSGSGILDTTNSASVLVPLSLQVMSFQRLVSQWKFQQGNETVEEKLSSSVLLLSAGGNDVLGGYLLNSSARSAYTPPKYVELLIDEYKTHIQLLYQAGGRKFVIAGLPPIGCTPSLRLYSMLNGAPGCFNLSNEMAQVFNLKVRELRAELSLNFPEADFASIQPYDYVMDMVNNGTKYGFTVTTENCCGGGLLNAVELCGRGSSFLCHRPSKYLFWDFHPTQKALWFLSSAIWNGSTTFMEPVNLRALMQL